ncbi:molybdopterin molybdotransferase MoeA [Rubripirellula amarantea]|nr:molybdopterin molybdotransferase MoeA [Rubripirellula amarantea]
MVTKIAFNGPDDALAALAGKLLTVPTELACSDYVGRVLGKAVLADRDSPAADVSAMDGYALRMSHLKQTESIAVIGEAACGQPSPEMPDRGTVRIFTGAIVPADCDLVVKREDTIEGDGQIELTPSARENPKGSNIRRAGENLTAGSIVFNPGMLISPAARAAMVNFGHVGVDLHKPVRTTVITTGDEVVDLETTPQPWQLRNSNLWSLLSLFGQHHWIDLQPSGQCRDNKQALVDALTSALETSDAVIMTGGVSMGDYDYVPDVVREVGGEVVFHGLPIRPGKPILGAATHDGKLILGLPGNPVSAVINARRMVLPLLAKMSGQTKWMPIVPAIQVAAVQPKDIPLHRMLLVHLNESGQAELVNSKGSGDLVSLGQSDGFIELPIGSSITSPCRFFAW